MLKLKRMKIILIILLCLLPLSFSQAEESLTQQQAKQYRMQGYRLQAMGDLDEALSFYQKAIHLDPSYTQAYNDIGVVYENMEQEEKALDYYHHALKVDPNFLPSYTNLAFLYEKRGDIRNATKYWKARYIRGQKGDYWREVARQHLLKLGTYPEVRKEILEEKAARLSRELVYHREQQRLQVIEEAKLHMSLGEEAFRRGEYETAIKELNTVLSLDPEDQKIQERARKVLKEARILFLKQDAFVSTKDALEYIKNSDYTSAAERLKRALTAVFRVTQEDISQKR
jgi:Flp pilus assembly protein TadD